MKNTKPDPDSTELSYFNWQDPNSLINLVSVGLREKIIKLPSDLLLKSGPQLESMAKPTMTDGHLRISFWDEHTLAVTEKRKMRMDNVYLPVATKQYFYQYITDVPMKLAWLVTPPADHHIKLRELLEHSHKRLRQILELPFIKKNGDIDNQFIRHLITIHENLENRVQGAVPQQLLIKQQSLSVSMDASVKEKEKTIHSIEEEIEQLRDETKVLKQAGKNPLMEQLESHGRNIATEAQAIETVGVRKAQD